MKRKSEVSVTKASPACAFLVLVLTALSVLVSGCASQPPPVAPNSSVSLAPTGIVRDSRNHIWFTEAGVGQLVEFDGQRQFTQYPLPSATSYPAALALDSQGALWVAEEQGNALGRFLNGDYTEYRLPTAGALPTALALQGATVWITEKVAGRLARLEGNTLTEYILPVPDRDSHEVSVPQGLTVDPRTGYVWFTEAGGNAIGVLNPAQAHGSVHYLSPITTHLTEQAAPPARGFSRDIMGEFQEPLKDPGLLKPSIAGIEQRTAAVLPFTEYLKTGSAVAPTAAALAPDGQMWVSEEDGDQITHFQRAVQGRGNRIVYALPSPASGPLGITISADGAGAWFVENLSGKLGRITTGLNGDVLTEYTLPKPVRLTGNPDSLAAATPLAPVQAVSPTPRPVVTLSSTLADFPGFTLYKLITQATNPVALYLDEVGNFWVIERETSRIGYLQVHTQGTSEARQ